MKVAGYNAKTLRPLFEKSGLKLHQKLSDTFCVLSEEKFLERGLGDNPFPKGFPPRFLSFFDLMQENLTNLFFHFFVILLE